MVYNYMQSQNTYMTGLKPWIIIITPLSLPDQPRLLQVQPLKCNVYQCNSPCTNFFFLNRFFQL